MNLRCRPFPVVIAAPSGAGKTTLARALVERSADIEFSVSATTRPPRTREANQRDYLFVSDAEFDRMIAAGELLEWAKVHHYRYGTPRQGVAAALQRGKLVLLDIDVQGARQVRDAFADAVLVFILPPSIQELNRRLSGRGSEKADELRARLATARTELAAAEKFDYIVLNDNFENAVKTLQTILAAERQRASRIEDFSTGVADMRAELATILKESD